MVSAWLTWILELLEETLFKKTPAAFLFSHASPKDDTRKRGHPEGGWGGGHYEARGLPRLLVPSPKSGEASYQTGDIQPVLQGPSFRTRFSALAGRQLLPLMILGLWVKADVCACFRRKPGWFTALGW